MSNQNTQRENMGMTIVTKKNRSWVMIPREALWENDLSLRATAIYIRYLSLQEGDSITYEDLIHAKDNRSDCLDAIQELFDKGYLTEENRGEL